MASLIPETEAKAVPPTRAPVEFAAKQAEERLNKRSRRLVTNIGPLGWWMSDMAIAIFSSMVAASLTPYSMLEDRHAHPLLFAAVFAICVSIFSHIFGFHDRRHINDSNVNIWRIAAVVGIALAATVLELVALHFMYVGRFVLGITFIVALVGMSSIRIIIQHFSENFAQVIGFVGDDDFCSRAGQFVEVKRKAFSVKRCPDDFSKLAEWAVENDVDQLVLDPDRVTVGDDEQLLQCLDFGVNVLSFPDFLESNYMLVPVDDINANWLFNARLDLAHPYYHGIKRMADVAASIAGLVLTAPVMLIAILAIKMESKGGPAFYSQIRSGRFTRPFRIYKLRTMIEGAEKDGAKWASASDTRITKIGKFLRKTRIDEIPQFWNVLKGDMSLVGPRPERPEFVDLLQREIPFYIQRHLVKPGVTGWAQINYPYGASVEDARNKLRYDLYYVKHSSISLDFQILLRTVGTIMKGSR